MNYDKTVQTNITQKEQMKSISKISKYMITTPLVIKHTPPPFRPQNNFCTLPWNALSLFQMQIYFKGSVLKHSSAFCDVDVDVEADFDFCLCLLILLFLHWARSFLVVDCETTRMFFILMRSHPQHLFPIDRFWNRNTWERNDGCMMVQK